MGLSDGRFSESQLFSSRMGPGRFQGPQTPASFPRNVSAGATVLYPYITNYSFHFYYLGFFLHDLPKDGAYHNFEIFHETTEPGPLDHPLPGLFDIPTPD